MHKKLSDKQLNEIENLYREGYSTLMLARKFNVHHSTIIRCLKRRNIAIRKASESGRIASLKGRLKQHRIPGSAKILTENKAYILGVMCGDGYLHMTKRNSYQIALQAIDRDFVIKFAKCLEIVYHIEPSISLLPSRHTNWNDKWQARICSKAVYNDILNYNQFMTYNWSVPPEILKSSNQIKAKFLMGFFDSEGNVDVENRRIHAISINLIGLKEIKSLLESIGIMSKIKTRKKTIGNRKISCTVNIQDRKSVELFYKFIGFSIKRKQERVIKLINKYKMWKSTKEYIKELLPLIEKLRAEKLSYEEIGKRLGIGTTTVWNYTNKSEEKS